MRYIIIGAGAVGGLIAARLHQAGQDVTLIARGDTGKVIARSGLRVMTPHTMTGYAMRVHASTRDAEIGPNDVIVLAMKTQDTGAALQDLAACVPHDTPIFCAQNGLENERLALRLFSRVYGVFAFVFAASLTPGEVRCYTAPSFGVLDLGCSPGGTDALAQSVAADLRLAGFDSLARDDITTWKAGKLLANLGNSLTASYGDSAALPDLLSVIQAEGRACLKAANMSFASLEDMLARRRSLLPLRKVQGQPFPGSSSWQSLARGATATEVDYLTGEIVLLGRLYGVPTPLNAALQTQVRRMAREKLAPGSLDPAALRQALEPATRTGLTENMA